MQYSEYYLFPLKDIATTMSSYFHRWLQQDKNCVPL
uniref:Uncharacterized protein n=1 Tax=Anguilla anguilla TaxID=7936 RepID=A0A0E9VUI8_ANGAN